MSKNANRRQRHKKVGSQSYLKKVHSFRTQIVPLRTYLNDLLCRIPKYSEPRKRQAILDAICSQIKDHGNDGLKKHRSLMIMGVRVLGGESVNFDGFICDKNGYPKHYGDLFLTLKQCRGNLENQMFSRDESSTKSTIELIRLVLSVLRWPYSVRLPLARKREKELLSSFRNQVVDLQPDLQYPATMVANRLVDVLRGFATVSVQTATSQYYTIHEDIVAPLEVRPSNRTYKAGRPFHGSERRLPESVLFATSNLVRPIFGYEGPTGKTTVISERAGKTRFITSYDGSVNSTNFYEKVVAWLHRVPGDSSRDQQYGHNKLRTFSERGTKPSGMQQDQQLYSVDLNSFTDNIHINCVYNFLEELRCLEFRQVIISPIYIGKEVVEPVHMLMGLKGTFEIGSLIHHGIVRAACQETGVQADYALCGDDLSIRANPAWFASYKRICSYVGLTVNMDKTVVSNDTGVFCGKVYCMGYNVTPLVPPLFTFEKGIGDFLLASSDFVASAKDISPTFYRVARHLVFVCGKIYRGLKIPYHLPKKLGGVGLSGSKGLLYLLSKVSNRVFCRFSDQEPLVLETVSKIYPIRDPNLVTRFPWAVNLAVLGATSKFRRKIAKSLIVGKLKDVYSCLEYYYFGSITS